MTHSSGPRTLSVVAVLVWLVVSVDDTDVVAVVAADVCAVVVVALDDAEVVADELAEVVAELLAVEVAVVSSHGKSPAACPATASFMKSISALHFDGAL